MTKSDVPNEVLLEEIRLNRDEIRCVRKELGGKVGRGELWGVLSTLGAIGAAIAAILRI